ncbi:MAG: hypothetical protein Homavirus10_13, partial [Homavirus sp.]
ALNVNSSTSNNINKTINSLTQEIQNTMSQTCVQGIAQNQALLIDNAQNAVVENVTLDQSATAYVTCLQQSQNYNNLVSNLATNLSQTASAETPSLLSLGIGLNSSTSSTSSGSSSSCLICIVILMFLLPLLMGGSSSSSSNSSEQQ